MIPAKADTKAVGADGWDEFKGLCRGWAAEHLAAEQLSKLLPS